MISISSVLILTVSILFFSYRAYKKGLWRTLLGIFGVVLTYIVCFFAGIPFVSILKSYGLNVIIAYPLGLILIFFVASFTFSHIFVLILPALKQVNHTQKCYGAVVGGVIGVVAGLFFIWGISTATSMLTLPQVAIAVDTLVPSKPKSDIIKLAASSLVATAVSTVMQALDEPTNQPFAIAFVEAPAEFASAFQEIAKGSEIKVFWQTDIIQKKMARNDASGLLSEPAFQALVKTSAMQKFLTYLEVKKSGASHNALLFLAENLSYVWRRMRFIRSDPRVTAILGDQEFKDLMNKKNIVVLLANTKVQSLVDIVMEKDNMENFDFIADLANNPSGQPPLSGSPSQTHELNTSIVSPVKSAIVYRWKDDNGKPHYTSFENIPLGKKDEARLFTPVR